MKKKNASGADFLKMFAPAFSPDLEREGMLRKAERRAELAERQLVAARKRLDEVTDALTAQTRAVEFLKSGIKSSGRTDFWAVREKRLRKKRA